tara:strand:- start:532 stop:936 length:405 start_codon:yes stop_codon:yes gene_type:complete
MQMNFDKNWEPRESDMEWLRNTLNRVNEGGIWATCLPEGDVAYQVSHEKKRLLLVGNENPMLHERTAQVAMLMGWDIMIPCKHCEDSGYEKGKVACHSCDGYGKAEGGWTTCASCEGYKDEDCIECGGKGEQYE